MGDSVFVCKFPAGNSLLPGLLVRERRSLLNTIELEDHHICLHSETSQTTQTQKDTVSEDLNVPTMDSFVDTQETKRVKTMHHHFPIVRPEHTVPLIIINQISIDL